MPHIKSGVLRHLKTRFIQMIRYIKYISNIKNGQYRVCIDYRNLTVATSNNEYEWQVAAMLFDATTNHVILTFIDRYYDYNQIFFSQR